MNENIFLLARPMALLVGEIQEHVQHYYIHPNRFAF